MKNYYLIALMASTILVTIPASAQDAGGNAITVDRVILSTSGLANLEHKTKVNGNAHLTFPVRLEQVDDILKSLVVFDKGGQIEGVTLPGKQPVSETFKDLPFTQEQLETPMLLLNAYQGASVTLKGAGSADITGKLLQVKAEESVTDKTTVTKHRISVMTDNGMRQAILEALDSIQFDDTKIRDEISKALAAIRTNRTSGNRDLDVSLKGNGERNVSLAYVVDAPVWKTAYRLVMPSASGKQGLLQGWAVIENMTASDWKDVDLTLVSGNPVTFRQPLYQSYYITRPELPVQVFGRVMPRVDEGVVASAVAPSAPVLQMKQEKRMMGRADFMAAPAAATPEMMMEMADSSGGSSADNISLAAQATETAEGSSQVLFHFPNRLSLKAGQSMMLPFVSRDLKMEQVALYQPDTHPTHPLSAVEIKNEGDEALPSGVLTLYEENAALKGSAFVGDARLPELPAAETRVVPYALDSKTTISQENKSRSVEGKISISQGVLKTSTKYIQEVVYKIKAPAKEARNLVIEQPKVGGYNLVEPAAKDSDETKTHYRFKIALKPAEEKTFTVRFENDGYQTLSLVSLDLPQLLSYAAAQDKIDGKTRKVFEQLAEMRREIDTYDQKIQMLEQQRQDIFADQKRVRENLKSLEGKSDIQQKYLDKLNTQEDQLVKLDAENQKLVADRAAKQKELNDAIAKIEI